MKYVTKAILPCVAIALAAFGIWSSLYSASSRHQGLRRVHDANNGFSIVPPSGWTSRGEYPASFMTYHGPQEGGFPVNFNVQVQHGKIGATPQRELLAVKQDLTKMLTNCVIVEEAIEVIDGKECFSLCVTFEINRPDRKIKLQVLQYGIPTADGKVYAITFTAPQDVFDTYRPTFERIAASARMD